jgi:hypothetical protein
MSVAPRPSMAFRLSSSAINSAATIGCQIFPAG